MKNRYDFKRGFYYELERSVQNNKVTLFPLTSTLGAAWRKQYCQITEQATSYSTMSATISMCRH